MAHKLMQVAKLKGIRGSLANQTMKNLSDEEKEIVEKITNQLYDNPLFIADKMEFIKQLRVTIGGEYKEASHAENEFRIALWRAVVHLMYHSDYSFKCKLCEKNQYISAQNTKMKFDRQYIYCPNCNKAYIKNTNDAVEIIKDTFYIIKQNDKDDIKVELSDLKNYIESPIESTIKDKKVKNHQEILDDDIQCKKWFSSWVWNFFRQLLNENKIQKHNQNKVELSHPANIMAALTITNQLKLNKIRYYIDENSIYSKKDIEIFCNLLRTDRKFTAFLISIIHQYDSNNIKFILTEHSIKITPKDKNNEIPIISDSISTSDPVIMLSFSTPSSTNDNDGWQDIVEHNAVNNNIQSSHNYVEEEKLNIIKNELTSTFARKIFDIIVQHGETWKEFSKAYQTKNIPAKSHMAKFLGISTKKVEYYKAQIKAAILLHDDSEKDFEIGKICREIETKIFDDESNYLLIGKEKDDALCTALLDMADELENKSLENTAEKLNLISDTIINSLKLEIKSLINNMTSISHDIYLFINKRYKEYIKNNKSEWNSVITAIYDAIEELDLNNEDIEELKSKLRDAELSYDEMMNFDRLDIVLLVNEDLKLR